MIKLRADSCIFKQVIEFVGDHLVRLTNFFVDEGEKYLLLWFLQQIISFCS